MEIGREDIEYGSVIIISQEVYMAERRNDKNDYNPIKAGTFAVLIFTAVVILVISFIQDIVTKRKKAAEEEYWNTKCYVYECEGKKAEGSNYCAEHKCALPGCS